MKKLLALLLVVVMMFSLVACVQDNTDPTKNTEGTEGTKGTEGTEGTEATEPTVDLEAAKYGGTFYLNLTVGDTFDPMKTSGWKSYSWSQNVYENILYMDAAGNLAPGVCNFELSKDALTLKLWVRDGVKFHNGDLVDIHDVKASFDRACANISRMKKHVVPYLVSAEVSENKYLTIKFSEYDPTTLYYFAANQVWNVVMMKEICEKYGNEPVIDVADAIGTGPYTVDKSSEPGVKMVLNKFKDYVPNEPGYTGLAEPKMGYMDQIIVQAYDDVSVLAMDFVMGEKNLSFDYEAEFDEMIKAAPGLRAYYSDPDSGNLYYLAFNCVNENVPCYNANIRKAIAAALDYHEIMDYEMGGLEYGKNSSPMKKGNLYFTEKYNAADYHGAANETLAKQYLQAANYNGEEIVFLLDQGTTIFPIFEQRLKAVGINVKPQYMDSTSLDSYITAPTTNNFDVTLQLSVVGDYIPSTLASNVLLNFYDGIDDIMEQLSNMVANSDEAMALWDTADQKITEDCPSAIFGVKGGSCTYYNNNVVWKHNGSWATWYNVYIDPTAK